MAQKKKIWEAVIHGMFLILGLITVGCVLLITVYLVISGIPAIACAILNTDLCIIGQLTKNEYDAKTFLPVLRLSENCGQRATARPGDDPGGYPYHFCLDRRT